MKNFLFITSFLILLAVVFSACKDKEPDYPIKISFEEYSLDGSSCEWTNLPYNDKVLVINSNEELEKYISCTGSNYPAVDFSKYSLLLASGEQSNGILNITTTDLQQYSSDKYRLSIEIIFCDTTDHKTWVKVLIAKKMSEGSKVRLNAIFKEQEIIYPIDIPFEDYSLEGTSCKWKSCQVLTCIDPLIINSDEELEEYLDCTGENNYPEIDFSKYTLLLTRGATSGYKGGTIYKSLQRTSKQNYVMKIMISITPWQVVTEWQVPIIIDKIPYSVDIELIVSHSPPY